MSSAVNSVRPVSASAAFTVSSGTSPTVTRRRCSRTAMSFFSRSATAVTSPALNRLAMYLSGKRASSMVPNNSVVLVS